MLSNFFIDRPIFATVLSIVIVILGAVTFFQLPIAQYPEVAPPVVQVSAIYPGANAKTVAETVATPIEQEVNGVERMLYMSSRCTNDGQMYLDVTFEVGTNLDMAQVLVQNRVSIAEAKLPEEVKRQGVTTKKKSPAILLCVNLISPDASYNQLYLSNFALMTVKDDLARLKGVGDVAFLGPRDYSMRIWLDPHKLAFRGIMVGEVVNAIREQNIQVAAGRIGQSPVPEGTNLPFQLTVNTQGRIESAEKFGKIIVKTGERGQNVYLKDVVRETKYGPNGQVLEEGVELGAKNYDVNSYLDGKPAVTLAVFQLPGSNALKTADAIKAKMRELKEKFPAGVDYAIYYDTTVFVNESIHEVFKTLIEAFILVFIVVLVFLQDWRATIIPMIAVPVSLIGTFAVMAMLGFSLNNLSLFGLVLAIGIVVDDAIVVVENVERYLAMGHSSREAARRAMAEVSGPVIAIALVLCAVFVPTALMAGISGEFFRQFALTIAASTIISAFNSLTLSPALCAILFKGHGAEHGTGDANPCEEGSLAATGGCHDRRPARLLHAHSAPRSPLGSATARRAWRGSVDRSLKRRGAVGHSAGLRGRGSGCGVVPCRPGESGAGRLLRGIQLGVRPRDQRLRSDRRCHSESVPHRLAGLWRPHGADLPRVPSSSGRIHPGTGQGISGCQCAVARRRQPGPFRQDHQADECYRSQCGEGPGGLAYDRPSGLLRFVGHQHQQRGRHVRHSGAL